MNKVKPDAARSGPVIWLEHHLQSLSASVARLAQRPFASVLTIAVLGLALTLPVALWLTLVNVQRLGGNVQQSRQVTVFLKSDIQPDQARLMAQRLRERADVADVVWTSPDEGLRELSGNAALAGVLDGLESNPLPHRLVVTPKGDEAALAAAIQAMPQADTVQHDAVWRTRLSGWLELGRRIAGLLAALLAAAAVLVVGNTVRLDIQTRREEIGVLQLLGATDGFVRRPFLYLGALYGLGAGVVALILLGLMQLLLKPPVTALAQSYASGFALQGLSLMQGLAVLGIGGLLGWLGAGIVTGHFLRQNRPVDES